MFILVTEPNHIHYDRLGLVTMSEYGTFTITLLPVVPRKVETFLHISNVATLGRNLFGEIEDCDDSMEDYEGSVRS